MQARRWSKVARSWVEGRSDLEQLGAISKRAAHTDRSVVHSLGAAHTKPTHHLKSPLAWHIQSTRHTGLCARCIGVKRPETTYFTQKILWSSSNWKVGNLPPLMHQNLVEIRWPYDYNQMQFFFYKTNTRRHQENHDARICATVILLPRCFSYPNPITHSPMPFSP